VRADGKEPGMRRERGTSEQLIAKSVSIKRAERKPGGCARKAVGLTSGGLRRVPDEGLGESRGFSIAAQESAEGVVGLRCQIEGPNGALPAEG
jgi:hypothetical protein